MRVGLIVLLTVVPALAAQKPASEPKSGSMCLATVKDDGDPRGHFSTKFAVRVDDGAWVAVPEEHPTLIAQLSLEGQHLVRVRDDQKQIQSFKFRFTDFDSPDLCLFYKPWYQTWSLRHAAEGGRSCRCKVSGR